MCMDLLIGHVGWKTPEANIPEPLKIRFSAVRKTQIQVAMPQDNKELCFSFNRFGQWHGPLTFLFKIEIHSGQSLAGIFT